MEADEFRKLVAESPLLIRMNDEREYLLAKPDFAIVGDYTAGILYRDNGRLLNGVISLLNIAAVLTRHETAGREAAGVCESRRVDAE